MTHQDHDYYGKKKGSGKKWIRYLLLLLLSGSMSIAGIGCRHSPSTGDNIGGSKVLFDNLTQSRFVKIPTGCFKMGQRPGAKAQIIASVGKELYESDFADELPRHHVCIDSFWLAEKEVTVALWRRFITSTSYKTDAEYDSNGEGGAFSYKPGDSWKKRRGRFWQNPGFSQEDNHPVTCISFNDIKKFLSWLNHQGQRRFRLPTEAEWEFACRGGNNYIRFWGNNPDLACNYANVGDQTNNEKGYGWTYEHACRDGYYYTSPVGSFNPNQFGLYDMLGNVSEWCYDRYDNNYYSSSPANNPLGPPSGNVRVIRGSSWNYGPANIRAANRTGGGPAFNSDFLGFRLAFSE